MSGRQAVAISPGSPNVDPSHARMSCPVGDATPTVIIAHSRIGLTMRRLTLLSDAFPLVNEIGHDGLAERFSTAMVGFAINRTTSLRIRLDQTRARQSTKGNDSQETDWPIVTHLYRRGSASIVDTCRTRPVSPDNGQPGKVVRLPNWKGCGRSRPLRIWL
jgi:hypothetical protein